MTRGSADDRPFTILFDRHKDLVWRVCYRFTGNPTDAEDLLQEVFFKTYRGLRTFRGRSTFRTWLYQIALNTCRNELRSRKRRPQTVDAHVDDLELISPETESADPLGPAYERVGAALLLLKDQEQEILVMRDIEEKSYSEIAETLGITLSAAKMRAQRARLALVSELKRLEEVEGKHE